jgi:pyruvate/2-oxoglutarate dehydrogenase complex dihydrolipoamide dehydrogenase (E3) component
LYGKKIVISTGSRATVDPIPGLTETGYLTHIEALELDHIPDHLLVLGGGYIGLEFAQAMRRLGSRVTIIERNDRLAHREDPDVSALLQEICRDEEIAIITGAHVTQVDGKSGEWVKLYAEKDGAKITQEGSHILVASGRTPNTQGIGLDLADVEVTGRGFVKVNERLETTAPDVFAVGDCAGSPHFTHIAFDDHRIVVSTLTGGNRVTTGRQVPFCLFTDPEFARIGLSETEAKAQGIPRTLSETRGFMKALVDTQSDRILGFTVVGVGGGEIMAAVQVAMVGQMPYTALRDTIFTHPTLLEGLVPLFSAVPARA